MAEFKSDFDRKSAYAMPWGIQRLNVKKSCPNDNINFIKPLSGPDEGIAQDFLERIAAQCRECIRDFLLANSLLMVESARDA